MADKKQGYFQKNIGTKQAELDYYNILSKRVGTKKASAVITDIKSRYPSSQWREEFASKLVSTKPGEIFKPTTKTSKAIQNLFNEAILKGKIKRTPITKTETFKVLKLEGTMPKIKPSVSKSKIKVEIMSRIPI